VKTDNPVGQPGRPDPVTASGPRGGETATSGDAAGERLVRLSVNLGPEVADQLKEYAGRKGVSVTEAVRRAIAILAFVDSAQARGASVNLKEGGALKEVLFLV
jgi:hypothetical protein